MRLQILGVQPLPAGRQAFFCRKEKIHADVFFTSMHHVDKFQCCLVKGDTAIDSPHEGGLAMLDIAAELGISGDISIPVNSDAAYRVVADFRNYWKKFKQIVKEYVEKGSPEAKRQKAITAAIFEMYRNREPAGTGDLTN